MKDLSNAYHELRHITHNLTPKSLFDNGLEEAIRRMQTLRPELTIHHFNNLNSSMLYKQAEVHLYRIALEALNNIYKHLAETLRLLVRLADAAGPNNSSITFGSR